ncbi:hypothetical protein HDV57DRAFT_497283 [Trichoderma longibrachiatum]
MPPRLRRRRYPCLFRPAALLVSPPSPDSNHDRLRSLAKKKAISPSRDQNDSVATRKHDSERTSGGKAIAPLLQRGSQRLLKRRKSRIVSSSQPLRYQMRAGR